MSFRDRWHFGRKTRTSLAGFMTAILVLFLLFELFGLNPFFRLERISVTIGSETARLFHRLRTHEELSRQLAQTEAERDRLAARAESSETLAKENEDLRRLLVFSKQRPEIASIPAHVIARAVDSARSELLIDAGSTDGITLSAAVLANEGMLIGKIAEVHANTSVVRLLTDPRTRVGVRVHGTETVGISEGTSGVLLSLRFIPQDATLVLHDLVLTSGLDAAMPANLEIGYITEVKTDPNAPFQSASVEPRLDVRLISVVAVVRPPL